MNLQVSGIVLKESLLVKKNYETKSELFNLTPTFSLAYSSCGPDSGKVQSYFMDPWNTFDFITVVGSIVDALMVEFAVRTPGT